MVEAASGDHAVLLQALEEISSATRLALLQRLARPGFVSALADEFGVSRQAMHEHVTRLEAVGLLEARPAWRGAARATEYVASPAGLFALAESLRELGSPAGGHRDFPLAATRAAPREPDGGLGLASEGLLLVHGDVPGRWFPLSGRSSFVIGRASANEVCLAYDSFASARHALLSYEEGAWRVTDLQSRNGTLVNLRRVPAGAAQVVRAGDLLTVGRSHLLMRAGSL